MRIENDFEVAAPLERVWAHLLDVEKVAPCVPGGQLTEVVDDHTWKGRVTMKMGPVSLAFNGLVTLQERDEEAHRVVLKAEGREQRGKGAATALSTSRLEAIGDRTKVSIETDLTITGAVAQYGRGMIGDISRRLTQQFADCLASSIAAEGAASAPAANGATPAAVAESPPDTDTTTDQQSEPSETTASAVPASDAASAPVPTPVQAATPPGGIRLGLWALWRAVVRLFQRFLGRKHT
jgi:carbon monoxide dehydrogenase subunit G